MEYNYENNPKQGRLISSRPVFSNDRFSLSLERHSFNGDTHEFNIIDTFDWVLVIPVEGDKFHMIWQYRPGWRRSSLEFPAGKLDKDEDYLVAAKRELREETGLIARTWKFLGEFRPITWTTQRCRIYLAGDLEQGDTDFDDTEDILPVTVAIDDFWNRVSNGDIVEIPTIAAYSMYKNQ